MKIGRKLYYDLHYSILKYKIEKAKEDLHIFQKGYLSLRKVMYSLKPYIDDNVSIPFDELMINPPDSIKGRLAERYVNKGNLYTLSDFEYQYEYYKKAHKRYVKHQSYIKELENKIRSYIIYTKIVKKFNLKLAKEIVERQYIFSLGYGLGKIAAVRKTSKRNKVNWFASLKRKEQILEKGGIPFSREEEKRALEEGKEYKGEKYLIYHPQENVWIYHLYTQFTSYKFQLVKSNVSDSLKKFLYDFKAKDGYNSKIFPQLKNII